MDKQRIKKGGNISTIRNPIDEFNKRMDTALTEIKEKKMKNSIYSEQQLDLPLNFRDSSIAEYTTDKKKMAETLQKWHQVFQYKLQELKQAKDEIGECKEAARILNKERDELNNFKQRIIHILVENDKLSKATEQYAKIILEGGTLQKIKAKEALVQEYVRKNKINKN
jgi:hypothetical protein